ncbi:MAG: hypothetical protein AUK47_04030 [Deltaproteobacteria bacterium CG2_30_63_29]|nr:MAG: hypothetical protein AUK47_04030 [Deltaproteobacteria bacterium CG2_30_63_29]PJB38524.1 MAG: hypothetical protein CO108_18980 [Deltaproteobacteria bacterium CG_4_9_14_3_um_filter_63_12]
MHARTGWLIGAALVLCASWAALGSASAGECSGQEGLTLRAALSESPAMSVSRMWSEMSGTSLVTDDEWFYGMSCDGPWSCSPSLITALEQRDARPNGPGSAPMCEPGEQGCSMQPGQPSPVSHLQMGHPLVPFLSDGTEHQPLRGSEEESERGILHCTLNPKSVVSRLYRPPR